jgi:hypothetical protein
MSANQEDQTRITQLEKEVADLQNQLPEHRDDLLRLIIQNAELKA